MSLELDSIMQSLVGPMGTAILANQLDELFVDASYVLRRLRREEKRLRPAELRRVAPKRIAILLPAWREENVIERMLEHNLASVEYGHEHLVVFCGTYRNDPGTQARVDAVAARGRPVRKVVVPHDGPTSKADCLNWIYQGVVLEERRTGRRFDILLMHDAEDVIDPLSLYLYSALIPRFEFVQTPVFSLALDPTEVVAGTYIDEFAEHHLKEMRVRQAMGGLVPSAGVGSAFDWTAFEEIALAHQQKPFNPESLTEDYEIGLKFRLARKRVHFASYTVEPEAPGERPRFIATREYFPDAFRASVRQRSRWILGIALQTWEQMGWRGPLPVRYCLWRDRKAVITNALLALAYSMVAYVTVRSGIAGVTGEPWSADAVVPASGIVHAILTCNLFGFAARVGVKMHFVQRLYGWPQAALCTPRLLVANVISFAATTRAVRTYVRHLVTGKPLRWVKTAHAFPSADVLASATGRDAAGQVPAAGAATPLAEVVR